MYVPASDEELHQPSDAAFWNESFYANFLDSSGGWGGCVRLGLSPSHRFADGGVYLFLPGEGLGVVRHLERRERHGEPISAGRIRWDRVEALRRWRVSADGDLFWFADARRLQDNQSGLTDHPRRPFRLELALDGCHDPFDFYPLRKTRLPWDGLRGLFGETRRMPARLAALPDQLERVSRLKGARHYEQACVVSGRLILDGREHTLGGAGLRDHSWGVREWQAFTRYRWLNCCFGPALSFSLARLQILGFRFIGGFVAREGRCVRVSGWELRTSGRQVRADVRTEDGATYAFTGSVQRELPISFGSPGYLTTITTAMTRFAWRDFTAYGVAESLEQAAP